MGSTRFAATTAKSSGDLMRDAKKRRDSSATSLANSAETARMTPGESHDRPRLHNLRAEPPEFLLRLAERRAHIGFDIDAIDDSNGAFGLLRQGAGPTLVLDRRGFSLEGYDAVTDRRARLLEPFRSIQECAEDGRLFEDPQPAE